MTSFEYELVKIGNELAEEYLSDKTIKEMVAENPENLDALIQKDVEETLEMKKGDLEFSHAFFEDKKPKVIYTRIPFDYEKIKIQKNALKFLVIGLWDKIGDLGLELSELDFIFKGEHPKFEFYIGKDGSMDIKIEYRYHKIYDKIGHKLLVSYPLGFEKYVENIVEYLGIKLGPLSIGPKT